jgi:enoyl-CoA hydratase
MLDNRDVFRVEERGFTAVITLNRPEKRNAMNLVMIRGLTELAETLALRPDLKAVVLTGGPEYFSAGMDLSDMVSLDLPNAPLVEQRKFLGYAPAMCQAWERMPQVTVAAIEGFCLGGGVSLASALDFRVMAESSRIRAPEIDLGMNMSWGTLPRLLHLVGPARTKELIIFGEDVGAQEALAWGFAQWITEDRHALEKALEIADKAAQKPAAPASMTKQTVNALATALDSLGSHMDRDQFLLSVSDPESRRRVMSSGFEG